MTTSTIEKMQTLRCRYGDGHDWTRPSQRGKPPHYCPEHKPLVEAEAPRVVVEKHDKIGEHLGSSYVEGKIAQANDEIAEIEAEEARKKAEAIAKRKATIAAREAQEAAEKAEHDREELTRLTERIPTVFAEWEKCFDKANKTNADEDWRHVTGLQNQVIGMKSRQRVLQDAVA